MRRVLVAICVVAVAAIINVKVSYADKLLSVAIVQVSPNFNPVLSKRIKTNIATVEGYAHVVKALKNPDMIVFPEVFIQGPDGVNEAKLAEPIPSGPIAQAMIKLAKQLKVWLIPGTIMEKGRDGKDYNTCIVISPEGKIVAKYRKLFPARPIEPSTPGSKFVVFNIPGKGKIGLMICYDAMFPEVARTLAWLGAQVIIKPTLQDDSEGGLRARIPIDQTRAMEDQCWIVDCNAAAPMGNGHSCIIDPEGRVIEKLGTSEAFTTAVIDLSQTRRVREYGSFAGGFTFLRYWAYENKNLKTFPPYSKGIANGPVFKTLSPGYVGNPSQIKPY